MKYTNLVIILVSQLLFKNLSAQDVVILGNTNNNVLYIGFDNKVEFGIKDGQHFEIQTSNVILTDSISKTIFDSISYTVKVHPSEHPNPTIFFGNVEDGGKVSKNETKLSAKNTENKHSKLIYNVVAWKIAVSGIDKIIGGDGNILTNEAIEILRNTESGTVISFMVTILYPDGSVKKRSAAFIIA